MVLMEYERNAKQYYHGTHKHWLDKQVAEYGRYQQPVGEGRGSESYSSVGLSFETSANYARDRAKRFGPCDAVPIVLVIDGDKVRSRIYQPPVIDDIGIDFLNLGEFKVVEVGWIDKSGRDWRRD